MAELSEASAGDIDQLAALQTEVRGGGVAQWAERIGRAVGAERSVVVVARVDGEITGYANVTFLPEHPGDGAPDGYYLSGVTVSPRWRRQGVGRALTRWRMAWVWARDPSVWCFVSARNRASLDLHTALGFVEVRRAPVLQGVSFEGGSGALLRAQRPI
ncbi:GNAT family N-acetyltransferase [Kitasatospora sp. RB6PN24]|uniref:GNAT family N-acetyltransferase n=1 Tax=Kitasatospora humi TaxID=2893891 RepID=UPI001E3F50B9|nr:GNAT family N-acetyltransferase [Kitasatospora humi]MCC9309743.1 GNAT family N-acetyltransferase [Kitasatospora humi]